MVVESSRMRKKDKKENRKGKLSWIIFTIAYIVFMMWLSGMAKAYFPNLVSSGGGQYFDVSTGVIIIGTSFYFVLAGYLYKKNNRNR